MTKNILKFLRGNIMDKKSENNKKNNKLASKRNIRLKFRKNIIKNFKLINNKDSKSKLIN